jgi:hypothetical protein
MDADMSAPNSFEVRRKRKRPAASRPNVPEFDFEMEINLDQHLGGDGRSDNVMDEAEDSREVPPPRFFTGSSSSDFILELDGPSVVSDAGIIMADPPKKNKEKKSSAKKGKGKHSDGVAVESESGVGIAIQGENHSLDIVDPKSKKKKSKAKSKTVKSTVEVLIQTKSKGAGPAKGEFKSKEFIDDEDDDDDDPLGMPALPSRVIPVIRDPEASSMHDSELEHDHEAGRMKSGRKGEEKDEDKKKSKKRKTMADDIGEDVDEEHRPGKKSAEMELIMVGSSSKDSKARKGKETAKNSTDGLDESSGEDVHKKQEVKVNFYRFII